MVERRFQVSPENRNKKMTSIRQEDSNSTATAYRRLIVNADDFGRNAAINAGIVRAVEHGIVTSASLMVRWPAAVAAAVYARRNRRLSVGLHVDLGEWEFHDGSWREIYQVVSLDDRAAIATELTHQVNWFKDIVGRDPTHIDSHQHIHRHEPVRSVLRDIARQLDVPLRHEHCEIRYCGDLYGQARDGVPVPDALTVEALTSILRSLDPGVTELGCHPGMGADGYSSYDSERQVEVEILCDPVIRQVLEYERIELIGFRDLTESEIGDARSTARHSRT